MIILLLKKFNGIFLNYEQVTLFLGEKFIKKKGKKKCKFNFSIDEYLFLS
jgi:hypothetical protein